MEGWESESVSGSVDIGCGPRRPLYLRVVLRRRMQREGATKVSALIMPLKMPRCTIGGDSQCIVLSRCSRDWLTSGTCADRRDGGVSQPWPANAKALSCALDIRLSRVSHQGGGEGVYSTPPSCLHSVLTKPHTCGGEKETRPAHLLKPESMVRSKISRPGIVAQCYQRGEGRGKKAITYLVDPRVE